MDTLTRQVRRASARLFVNRLIRSAAWFCFVALCVAAILVGVDKRWPLGAPSWTWIAGAAGAGLLLSIIYTWFTRPSLIDAAVELDRRFNLKERVSSALALDESERETAIGHALAEDAARRVAKIDVGDKFRLAVGRTALLPFAAAAVAFGIATFVEPFQPKTVVAAPVSPREREKIQKQTRVLREQIQAQNKKAEQLGLEETAALLTKLEEGTKQASELPDRQKAMVKMNDLVKEVEQRRNQVGASDRLRQQLDQLKDLKKGPADKLADALKKGDMAQAAKELKELADKIANGKLNEQEKQALANQMQQMQQKLQQMADKQKEMEKNLQQQIQQQKAAGNKAAADELEKQLAELKQQAAQDQNMQKLAEQLGKAAKDLQNGDAQAAMEQLQGMQAEMEQLQKQLAEMDMLEQALDQLQQCKGGMGKGDKPGNGLGEGRGRGARPEEKTDTKSYNTNVKQKLGPGKSVVVGEATGPNVKGDVEALIQTEFTSAEGEAVDPLTDQNLPRSYREHTKKYFDKLREGK